MNRATASRAQVITSVCVIFLILTMAAVDVSAQSAAAPSPDQMVAFLNAGMIDARNRLRTGVFRATGRWIDALDSGGILERDWEVFCAFDHDRGLLRFDQDMQFPEALPQGATAGQQSLKLYPVRKKMVISPDKAIYWCDDESAMVELWPVPFEPNSVMRLFDVRTVGLLGVHSFGSLRTIEKSCEAKTHMKVRNVSSTAGMHLIVYHVVDAEVLMATTIDENRGFTPIHSEARDLALVGESAAFDQAELIEKDSVTWKQINGQWVAESMLLVQGKNRRELAFEWESVNQPVSETLFQKEGLGLPGGTWILDNRLGRGIVIGSLDGSPTGVSNDAMLRSNRSRSWLWATLSGLLLTIGIAGWIMLKRSRPRSRG